MPPPPGRLLVKRDGHSITRQNPKPIVIIDTREKIPFTFGNHNNWLAGTVRHKFTAGDYSVEGMEPLLFGLVGRAGGPFWHPGDLHLTGSGISRRKSRQLSFQTFHLLVFGEKGSWAGIAGWGFLAPKCTQLSSFSSGA